MAKELDLMITRKTLTSSRCEGAMCAVHPEQTKKRLNGGQNFASTSVMRVLPNLEPQT